jgi:hypothetical protein
MEKHFFDVLTIGKVFPIRSRMVNDTPLYYFDQGVVPRRIDTQKAQAVLHCFRGYSSLEHRFQLFYEILNQF